MKHWIAMTALLLALPAAAQVGVGGLTYRQGDPFLFCTQGQFVPAQWLRGCWWPLDPASGTFTMNPSCDPPDPYGRPWSSDDYASLAQYQSICPQAIKSGSWKGTGDGSDVPFSH
jgi:hypothetical protein